MIAALLARLDAIVALLTALVDGRAKTARRPLGPDSLVTPEEIRAEVGWGEKETRAWLRGLPVRHCPGRKTRQYRWGDVLAELPWEGDGRRVAKRPPTEETSGAVIVPRRMGTGR